MNKTSKFFLGFASLSMLAACSSDEPVQGGQDVITPGETAYLTITLRDANDLSRAGKPDSETPVDGEFDYGTDNEAMVKTARFYFFDGAGIYAGQSNIWNGGTPETDTPDGNIEFRSPSLVVLDNLKNNEYPTYMVTVLNGAQFTNAELTGKSLADFSKEITSWGSNTEYGFVMASTSYFNESGKTDVNHSDTYYYATVLDSNNFARTPEAAKAEGKPVDVYVERLAARIHLASAKYFDVKATVFGAEGDNPNTGNNEAATKLKVRIDGWYINGTQENSYLLKQLNGWSATSDINSTATGIWNWNMPSNHRSYWGKSIDYSAIADLTFLPYKNDNVKNAGAFDYCNENTTTRADLAAGNNNLPNQQKLTSVVLKATVGTVDEEGNFKEGLYLVQHNGAYFTKTRFINYAADVAKSSMPYTRKWEGTGEGTAQANGKYVYTPLFDTETIENYLTLDGNNDKVYVTSIEGKIAGDLYTADGEKFVLATYETALKNVTDGIEGKTRAFNGGSMYYNIPIAHLNSPIYDENGDLSSWQESSFGVVRNHAYEVKIKSVKRLGQGIFNPDDNETPIVPDPDPKDPNWYLGATINILSWKIVSNSVDL